MDQMARKLSPKPEYERTSFAASFYLIDPRTEYASGTRPMTYMYFEARLSLKASKGSGVRV